MQMEGKYIWIWELDRCENGDIGKLIQHARDVGIDGYIIKTHDGSNFWYQSHAVKDLKDEGLKIGAWGYCYGKNVTGEINAIKKSVSLGPDFYVLDVEVEFEDPNMAAVAEQLLTGLKDIGIPLGYTSFAIPDYHSVPYDVFSKYCSFVMPQIYWKMMRWQIGKAFQTSYDEYSKYGLPIYPIGQITSDVPPDEIIHFNDLCREKDIPFISYWDCQETTETQLNAIKQSNYADLQNAVNILKDNGIIQTPEYWLNHAVTGQTVSGEYAKLLITRAASKLRGTR